MIQQNHKDKHQIDTTHTLEKKRLGQNKFMLCREFQSNLILKTFDCERICWIVERKHKKKEKANTTFDQIALNRSNQTKFINSFIPGLIDAMYAVAKEHRSAKLFTKIRRGSYRSNYSDCF